MTHLPTGTVTFLFTDIEGSTQLWEQYPEAMKGTLARHDALLRLAIEANNGYIFKTVGDAFYAAFPTALEALTAALAAQRLVQAEAWGETPIRVRVALHTGAADEREGDYFGPPLNRVARLLSSGHGGQMLISFATKELLHEHLPAGIQLRDMGERRLKDLIRPEHIYQVLAPDLPTGFPPLKTLDTFRTNLPAQLTSFVGREKEIAEVKALLAASRLITLTGPGGTGKTRLSLQVAIDLLDMFSDGIWFIELAPVSDPGFVSQTVATALGLREEAGRPIIELLTDFLQAKRSLLILDNCEHLVEASARLAESLLRACPDLKILASSREALKIAGETPYRVPSLSTPDPRQIPPLETLTQYEAVRLFVERATTALPSFTVTPDNAIAVTKVCQRLDGIPLGIELAAARVKMLKVEQIAARLDDRFRLLTGGSRTALPRQQTLRALIDWSHDLLSESERALLRQLSVFAGGWTLEAAEQVAGGTWQVVGDSPTRHLSLATSDVLDLLTQLVNKSLVDVERVPGQEVRYRLLETIRQYAREKLLESGEGEQVRDRHLDYFVNLAERAEPELTGPRTPEWLKRLEVELDNLRTGLEWALEHNAEVGLQLASILLWFWVEAGYINDGINWLVQLLRQPETQSPTLVRARALDTQGYLLALIDSNQEACPIIEESLDLCRDLGDRPGIASGLLHLGLATYHIGLQVENYRLDPEHGLQLIAESLALYRELGDKLGLVWALGYLGRFLSSSGDYERARAYLEEGLATSREIEYPTGMAYILISLGELVIWQGDCHAARPWLEESLVLQRQLGKSGNAAFSLGVLGDLAFREGNYLQARAYYEDSISLAQEVGATWNIGWGPVRLGYVALRQGDAARAKRLFEEGQQHLKEIGEMVGVVYALEGLASLATMQEQPERAARIFAWADATREAPGHTRPPVQQADVDRDLATIHSQLDEATFSAVWAEGQAMTLEQAVAYALEEL